MTEQGCDVLIIGGGPAGLAAGYAARQGGADRVLIIERNPELGGILPQCIHNGFGLSLLDQDLTGPEYASHWVRLARDAGVESLCDTMVLSLHPSLSVTASSHRQGLVDFRAKAIVLAMGCRERPRGALAIPGTRPAGVFTAGTAQRLVNVEGSMPGRRFAILGSGDIGMIMARRLTLEGATVEAMLEIQPYISGLRRNLVQCIRDFRIPLHLCSTVVDVRGHERVESVVVAQVDDRWRPVAGSEWEIACDSLLLSVGLIPENELSRMAGVLIDSATGGPYVDQRLATNVPGIFAAGNVAHVYDLVDDVTRSALRAGSSAADHALGRQEAGARSIRVVPGKNVGHILPQRLVLGEACWQDEVELQLRVRQPMEAPAHVGVWAGDAIVATRRLRYARPGEMITVCLRAATRERLRDVTEIRVDVVEQTVGSPTMLDPEGSNAPGA